MGKNKGKRKRKGSKKRFWNQGLYDWRLRHEGLATLCGWFLMIGIALLILIPLSSVKVIFSKLDLNLLMPIYLNGLVFAMALLTNLFYEKLKSFRDLIENVSQVLVYVDGFALPLHFFIGLPKKGRGLASPSLLSMDGKPIWVTVALYIGFFSINYFIYNSLKKRKNE